MYLLSIIIPIYNAAPYLAQCLDSIIASVGTEQTAVEVILVNDGSTDTSARICEEYAGRVPFVRLFHKENGGVASARNLGLAEASGMYVAWIDPDDYVHKQWFSCIRTTAERFAPDVIVIDTVRFGTGWEKDEVYGRTPGLLDWETFVEDVIRDVRIHSGLPNKIMKRQLCAGVQFDTALQILEDYAALPRILGSGNSAYYIPQCLYYYRQHESSLLHKKDAAVAFRSVETAAARESAVPQQFLRAARISTAWQAFRFCRNHYVDPDFTANKQQIRFCRKYIRKNYFTIAQDQELSAPLKFKMFLLAAGLYGMFAGRNPFQKKGE